MVGQYDECVNTRKADAPITVFEQLNNARYSRLKEFMEDG
jgi:hypothetical protein